MYRLYLVEDDDNIRNGLSAYFDWESMGIQLAGSAADGESALNEILEKNVDIVLTDVMMPGMSGLEMAQELRNARWNGSLVFLSAYGDSQKLQSALRIHAADYVLKPFEDEDIFQAMRRAVEKLEERKHYDQMKREQCWRCIIQGETPPNQAADEQYLITVAQERERPEDVARSMQALPEVLWAGRNFDAEVIAIWSSDCEGTELEALVGRRLKTVEKDYPTVRMATSPAVSEVWRVPGMLMQLRESLKQSDIVLGSGSTQPMPVEQLAAHILQRIHDETGDLWIYEQKETLFHELNSADVHKLTDLQDRCIVLIQTLANALGTDSFGEICEKWRKRICLMLMACDRTEELFKVLISGIQALYSLALSERESMGSYARIVAAVNGHLREVSLAWIAEQTGLTKWNITKVIRAECGSTVNVWIQKQRIQEATRLLLETDLKVYEISAMVGYSTVDYFTTVFRDMMHVTPKQFRGKNVAQK